MQRFRKFIGGTVLPERLEEEARDPNLGIELRYLPEELEEFDEIEIGLGHDSNRTIVLSMVVVEGQLQRLSLGYVPERGDEDDFYAFGEAELEKILESRGDQVSKLLERTVKAGRES